MSRKYLLEEFKNRANDQFQKFKKSFASVVKETDIGMDLEEPYTSANAPAWVKKLPIEARDGWIKTFNAAFNQYKDDGKAFAVANSALGKMGYKKKDDKWVKEAVRYTVNNASSPREIFSSLISDINLFLNIQYPLS